MERHRVNILLQTPSGFSITEHSEIFFNGNDTNITQDNISDDTLLSKTEDALMPKPEMGNNFSIFTIRPNPTTGKFLLKVSVSNSSPSQVFIYDIFGRTIMYNSIGSSHKKNISNSSIQDPVAKTVNIDISDHASGIYFVKVLSGEDVFM